MALDTKPNLSSAKFEQFSGETLNLSGTTVIYGEMKYGVGIPQSLDGQSFTSRDFVESLIGSGSTGSTLAGNGLTKVGDTIVLGGTLTGNTEISGGGNFAFIVVDTTNISFTTDTLAVSGTDGGVINVNSGGVLLDDAGSGGVHIFATGGGNISVNSSGGTILVNDEGQGGVVINSDGGGINAIDTTGNVSTKLINSGGQVYLEYEVPSVVSHAFVLDVSGMEATSTDESFPGIVYGSDYSANFVDRSLVDKAYVLSVVSGLTGTTGGSVTANNGLTKTGENIYLGGLITGFTEIVYTANTLVNTIALGSNNALYVTAENEPQGAYSEIRVRPQDISLYSDDRGVVYSSYISVDYSATRMSSENQDLNSYAEIVTQTPVNTVPEARIFILDGNTFSNNIAQFQPSGFTFTVQDPYNEDTSVFKLMSGTTSLYAKHGIDLNGLNSEIHLNSDTLKIQYTNKSIILHESKIGFLNDDNFIATKGFGSSVRDIAIQADGKIIAVGAFDSYGSTYTPRIVRINTDGTIDSTFNGVTLGFDNNSFKTDIEIQLDGKILVGDTFTQYNGVTKNRIVRLNTDGSIDSTFTGLTSTGFNSTVACIKQQPDGKILVGGTFTSYNGTTRNRIVRLTANGDLDPTFSGYTTGFNQGVYDLLVQPDGKIVAVGAFTQYNGVARPRVTRLTTTGAFDTTFSGITTGVVADAFSIERQSSGKLILVGTFTTYNGTARNRITRINVNGSLDTTFTGYTSGLDSTAYKTIIDATDKIVVVGQYTTYNGTTANRVVRLNVNGSRDLTFSGNTLGFNNTLTGIALQGDGKIVVAGDATTYNADNIYKIARLNTNGTNDGTFTQNTIGFNQGVEDLKVVGGKFVAAGNFTNYNGVNINRIIRLNSNYTADATFSGVTTGFDASVNKIATQSSNKIIAVGTFTSYNGTARNRITRINVNGSNDTTFTGYTSGLGAGATNSLRIQPDNKILVGGNFTTYNGVARNRLVRLTTDGAYDASFSGFTTGFNATVRQIELLGDGKILVCGNFTTYNGVAQNRIIRLNPNGSKDTTFSGYTSGFVSEAYGMAVQPDGKILLCGNFSQYNGVSCEAVVRLNANGSRDLTFSGISSAGFNSTVEKIFLQDDGKIFVSGFFSELNNEPVNYLVRLNSDGTRDTSFDAGRQLQDIIYGILQLENGSLLLHGYNGSYDGKTIGFVANVNDYVELTVANSDSMKYADDYSSNFTDRSLVDKAYVDGLVGGGTVTANNGLTKAGNNIHLGGALTGATTITSPGTGSRLAFAAFPVQYSADLSANYNNRSIVDKGFVTGLTSQNSKSSFSITGNNVTTTFTVTHNKNTRDVIVQVYEVAAPYGSVLVDTLRTTVNTVDVVFSVAPATSVQYRVVII